MVVKPRFQIRVVFHDDFVFDVCNLDSFLVMFLAKWKDV